MTSAAPAMCPPHYWLVEDQPSGDQHWACYRCGAERDQPLEVPVDRPHAPWASYTPRASRPAAES
jgi:hypothetical protein